MKKLLLIALVVSGSLFAQTPITITSTDMPLSGDTLRYANTNANSINVTQTGANYYWNFDSLVSNSQGMYNYQASSQTAYAFYFAGAGNYGLKVADSIGTSPYEFKNIYDFYKGTTSYFDIDGVGITYSGFPIGVHYTDPDELYQFPLTYQRHDSSTFKFIATFPVSTYTVTYSQRGYRINDVDGWGVIKTPYDSVTCLRLVSTDYETDSININGLFPIVTPNYQRSYKWMVNGQHIPFLEVDGRYANNTFTPTSAKFRIGYNTFAGIKKYTDEVSAVVYPNPAQNYIVVQSNYNKPSYVQLCDVTGKIIEKTNCTNGMAVLDIKSVPSQVCYYQLVHSNGQIIHSGKIIITH